VEVVMALRPRVSQEQPYTHDDAPMEKKQTCILLARLAVARPSVLPSWRMG
jgi:hypothetical protein